MWENNASEAKNRIEKKKMKNSLVFSLCAGVSKEEKVVVTCLEGFLRFGGLV
jgi:hypothetical protein